MFWEFSEKGIVFFPDPNLIGTPGISAWIMRRFTSAPQTGCACTAGGCRRPGRRSWSGSTATPATSATAWKTSSCSTIWPKSRSSSSITGNTASPRVRSAGRVLSRMRPRPIITWPKAGRCRPLRSLRPLPGYRPGHGPGGPRPCRSLIIESAFTNSSDMAKLFAPFMFDWRPSIPYDNLGKVDKLKVPLLIIHGADDEIIPVAMGRRLFAAAGPQRALHHPRGPP